MTVKDLKTELEKYPDNMDVIIDTAFTTSDDQYQPTISVYEKTVRFEDKVDKLHADVNCIVIEMA